jgi:glycosyltransferase involved in cell wall biosynthesis
MALGKAIISVPLKCLVPSPLRHGKEVHYVEDCADDMRRAILQIRADDDYRRSLGENARAYYLTHLSPAAVIQRILGSAMSHSRDHTEATVVAGRFNKQ